VRRGIAILFALILGWALTTGVSSAPADTTVSLTFDDGNADQLAAQPILAEHGTHATFFIITDRVGTGSYMSWSQIQSLFDNGNEIGGHTTDHQHLTQIPPDQAKDAICNARQALLARGYPQVSFAYPFGEYNAATEKLVEECGYASGRSLTSMADWPGAESIPPADRWAIRTPGSIDLNDHLDEIEGWIMDAEQLGQTSDVWIPLVIHHLCDPNVTPTVCSDPNGVDNQFITPHDFDALLDWLADRESLGTTVKTVAQVIGPDAQPPLGQATLVSVRSLPNGKAKLVFVVGGPGTLEAIDAGSSAVIAKKKHRARIRPASKFVAQAGDATLVIRASKAGKRTLKRKGKLKVPVRVTFTPLSGSPQSQTIKVKLRLKRHRHA
jgi:hypothetical protein